MKINYLLIFACGLFFSVSQQTKANFLDDIGNAVSGVAKGAYNATKSVVEGAGNIVVHPKSLIGSVVHITKRAVHDVAHPKDALHDVLHEGVALEKRVVHTSAGLAHGVLSSGLVKNSLGSVGLGKVDSILDSGVKTADGLNSVLDQKVAGEGYIPAGMHVPSQKGQKQVPDKYYEQKRNAKETVKQLLTLDQEKAIKTLNMKILSAKIVDKVSGPTMVALMIIVAVGDQDQYGKFLDLLAHDDLQSHNMQPVLKALLKIAPNFAAAIIYDLKETGKLYSKSIMQTGSQPSAPDQNQYESQYQSAYQGANDSNNYSSSGYGENQGAYAYSGQQTQSGGGVYSSYDEPSYNQEGYVDNSYQNEGIPTGGGVNYGY